METHPSPLSSQETPKPSYEHSRVPHGPSRSIPGLVEDASINDATMQQRPHHRVIGTLLRPTKRFQDAIHHQGLVPKLIVERRPSYPVVVPIIAHHCQVYPLQRRLSDLSTQIWTRPYLLIQQVMLSITGMHMESNVLTRYLVSHGAFKGAAIDERHSRVLEWFKGR